MVFKTPAYKEQYLTKPKDVFMQLQRSSDLEGSETILFTYQPEDPGKKHEHGIYMGESFQDNS